MYKWCGINTHDFWEYTPSEARLMVNEALDKMHLEHAWLNAVIFNSQGAKKDGSAWSIDDFMPEERTTEDNESYTKTWCENFKQIIPHIGGS